MLKRIFSYMKQYKKYACLALLCIAVEAVLELMVPMIMADLIDNGVANGDTAYIYTKGLQMAEAEGVDEAMKAENQMLWVQSMNSIRSRAEEIIKHELIYC